jgi:hypothetical protein
MSGFISFVVARPRCDSLYTNPVPTQGMRLTNTAIGQPYSVVQEVLAEPQAACLLVRTTLKGGQAASAKRYDLCGRSAVWEEGSDD